MTNRDKTLTGDHVRTDDGWATIIELRWIGNPKESVRVRRGSLESKSQASEDQI